MRGLRRAGKIGPGGKPGPEGHSGFVEFKTTPSSPFGACVIAEGEPVYVGKDCIVMQNE